MKMTSSTFVPSASSLWESTAPTNSLASSNNVHCDINSANGYAGDLATSYNAIWEHRHHRQHQHHHHHHAGSPGVPYRPEFFPGFACSTEFWPPPQTAAVAMPIHNSMASNSNNDSYRSANVIPHQRSSSSGKNCLSNREKKTRRRVATYAQRRAANIRERRRMFNLNEAFDKLRRKVPTFAYEKRLSRIETLRLAITYISFMDEILNGNSVNDATTSSMYQMHSQREYVPYVIL